VKLGPLKLTLLVGVTVAAAPVHEIPFDFRTRQPIIRVRVNGGRPVPFLFDTGASIHVVDEAIAREAGVVGSGVQSISGGGQASVPAQFAEAVTFETGPISWDRQRAAIVRLGYPDTKHFAGFIGAPILMRYVVQFDFDRQIIRLIDPSTYQPPAGAVLVPFELQGDLPVVRAIVDAGAGPVEARLMVDTGAGDVFADLNRPFVDTHRLLEALKDAAPSARPAGIGGTAPFVYGTGKRMVVGGIPFDRPRLGLSRATSGSSSRTERDGIIGNDLLRRFRATFDYRRRTLVLEKP
jgi:hypothetical protein